MKKYPLIIGCIECGARHVPVPLREYPIDMAVFSKHLLKIKQCPSCGAPAKGSLTVDMSDAAKQWYDDNVRASDE